MMTAIEAGMLVKGKYQLGRELARGGMGALWVAYDRDLRRQVAIKFLSMTWINYADACQRFEREALSTAQVRSPNVVQTYDYGIYKGQPYMVLELLEGEDLSARLHREGRINFSSAQAIISHVLRGLIAVHAAGIIHRDLKPANIFLARVGQEQVVKLLDFGIARIASLDSLDEKAGAEQVFGTPKYMSPEQAMDSARVDVRSDLWSVGVVLYRIITGEHPFQSEGETSFHEARRHRRFTPPSKLVADLPSSMDAFMTRALSHSPSDRFPSAQQMLEALIRLDTAELDSRRRAITARMQTFPELSPPCSAVNAPLGPPPPDSAPTRRSRSSEPTVSEKRPTVEVVPAPPVEAFRGSGSARDDEPTVPLPKPSRPTHAQVTRAMMDASPEITADTEVRSTVLPPAPLGRPRMDISLKRFNRTPSLPVLPSATEDKPEKPSAEPFLLITRKAPARAAETPASMVGLLALALALVAATGACVYGTELGSVAIRAALLR